MTMPPNGQQPPGPGQPPPPPGYGPPGGQPPPPGPGQPGQWGGPPPQAPPQKKNTTKWVAFGAAGVLGLGLVGGGAVFAASQLLGGGGPQPEEALPATSVGFAKIDLDPSADQKVDALRFLRKFPSAREDLGNLDDDADMRKTIFEELQEDGTLEGVDYEQDIEPWLGQRFGVAMLPTTSGGEPDYVVALASTDQEAAEEGLAKATEDGGYCSVQEDFAICGEVQSVVDKAVNDAESAPLSEDSEFTQDMDDLGEDGLVTAWMDGPGLSKVATEAAGVGADLEETGQGRYAVALRFDGPHLELAGHANALPEGGVPSGDSTSIGDLPADTLGAFGVSGLDEAIKNVWPDLDQTLGDTLGSDWQQGVDQFTAQTGISLPDDVAAAVGSDTVVSVAPSKEPLKFAVRTDGDRAVIDEMVGAATGSPTPGSPQLTVTDAGDGKTVVANDSGYADEVASGSGLGDSEAFQDAVPDADKASTVGYVNIAKVAETFGGEMTDEERKNIEPLSAVGFAMWGEGDSADFSLRLTTK